MFFINVLGEVKGGIWGDEVFWGSKVFKVLILRRIWLLFFYDWIIW